MLSENERNFTLNNEGSVKEHVYLSASGYYGGKQAERERARYSEIPTENQSAVVIINEVPAASVKRGASPLVDTAGVNSGETPLPGVNLF